jgi:hypothetical protein
METPIYSYTGVFGYPSRTHACKKAIFVDNFHSDSTVLIGLIPVHCSSKSWFKLALQFYESR